MGFFSRLSSGWDLAVESWHIVLENKVLMVFPILSGIATLCALTVMFGGGHYLGLTEEVLLTAEEGITVGGVIGLFLVYMVFNTITIFFNVALISCASRALSGLPPKPMRGLYDAFERLHYVLMWAAVSSSVAVLLNIIERHKTVGKIVRAILGTVWSVLTYLVLPVMVFERLTPWQAFKRSKDLIFQTWGESLSGHVGMGILSTILALPAVILFVFGILTQNLFLLVAAVLWGFAVILWGATAETVLRVAIYGYAAGVRLQTDYFSDLSRVFYDEDGHVATGRHPGRMDAKLRAAAGGTDLHRAIEEGNFSVVKALTERGADLQALDKNGKTPVELAMQTGRVDIAQYLYDEIEKAKGNPFEDR